MRSDEAEAEFLARLAAAGVPIERGAHVHLPALTADHPGRAWEVFKAFAELPVEDVEPENDGLLFEAGVFDFDFWGGGKRYDLGFTRQFTLYREGEYDRMEQLHCDLLFEPAPELEAIPAASLWSFDLPLKEFFARVEEMPAFRVPLEGGFVPVGARVALEPV